MSRPQRTIERDKQIVEFCSGGKTSFELEEHFGIQRNTITNILSRLHKKEGQIYVVFPEQKREFGRGGLIALYVKVGTESTHAPVMPKEKSVDPDEHKWNEDFIRVAHKCLHLGAIC